MTTCSGHKATSLEHGSASYSHVIPWYSTPNPISHAMRRSDVSHPQSTLRHVWEHRNKKREEPTTPRYLSSTYFFPSSVSSWVHIPLNIVWVLSHWIRHPVARQDRIHYQLDIILVRSGQIQDSKGASAPYKGPEWSRIYTTTSKYIAKRRRTLRLIGPRSSDDAILPVRLQCGVTVTRSIKGATVFILLELACIDAMPQTNHNYIGVITARIV